MNRPTELPQAPHSGSFIAGTLVHTKEGLKPIEKIQVGDWVLSKPENGGEQAYKRVLKTFEYPPEQVIKVVYFDNPAGGPMRIGNIFCTPNHPFWLEAQGWTAAEDVADSFDEDNPRRKDRLLLADESRVFANHVSRLYFTNDSDYCWEPNTTTGPYDASDVGFLINIKTRKTDGKKSITPSKRLGTAIMMTLSKNSQSSTWRWKNFIPITLESTVFGCTTPTPT